MISTIVRLIRLVHRLIYVVLTMPRRKKAYDTATHLRYRIKTLRYQGVPAEALADLLEIETLERENKWNANWSPYRKVYIEVVKPYLLEQKVPPALFAFYRSCVFKGLKAKLEFGDPEAVIRECVEKMGLDEAHVRELFYRAEIIPRPREAMAPKATQ